MSNSEIIEWLKNKAKTTPMPGARKMYEAAARALEAQKDMVSRKTANVAICNACGKIDCDQADKCEKLYTTQEAAVKHREIRPGDEVERYVDGRYDGRAMFLAEDGDQWTCLFWTGCGYTTLSYPKSQFRRTSRHYNIEPVLEGIRNESVDSRRSD